MCLNLLGNNSYLPPGPKIELSLVTGQLSTACQELRRGEWGGPISIHVCAVKQLLLGLPENAHKELPHLHR